MLVASNSVDDPERTQRHFSLAIAGTDESASSLEPKPLRDPALKDFDKKRVEPGLEPETIEREPGLEPGLALGIRES